MKNFWRALFLQTAVFFLNLPALASGEGSALEEEAIGVLQKDLQIDTSKPPGRATKAADFLEGFLKNEGIATKRYVIPGQAEATIDCRLPPEDSPDELLARIKACLKDDPDLSLDFLQWPHAPPPPRWDHDLYRAIESLLTEKLPGAIVVPALMTGGTDARFFRDKGIPAPDFDPTVRTLDQQKLFHGDNERISASEFQRGLGLYGELLLGFLK